jgi:hypothetical protein
MTSLPAAVTREGERSGMFSFMHHHELANALLVPTPILLQTQSSLLQLPDEIRNKIYEYALETRPLLIFDYYRLRRTQARLRQIHHINELAQTCRQFRLETGDMCSAWCYVSGALLSILPVSKPTHAILYHVPYPYDDTDRICDLLQFTNLLCYYVYTCEQDPQLELAYLTDFLEVRKKPL